MKNKIIAYQLVFASFDDNFVGKINDLIEEGWQPFNSPFVRKEKGENGREELFYYQTMVQYSEVLKSA